MAGGGTGGHVIPALAVARELKARGHKCVFVGTRTGFEARMVPEAGFDIEYIEAGGLKRVGAAQIARTLLQLPLAQRRASRILRQHAAAVFSMGGYVAGPVVLGAILRGVPIVVMEPNAMPGAANRWVGRFVSRALLSFPEAERFFARGRTEITGLPVRPEFFQLPERPPGEVLNVLVTGGSRGSRTLNEAARASWALFSASGVRVRFIHQTGREAYDSIAAEFVDSGTDGLVLPFIQDMPAVFAEADLVVCRAGAGAVAELAAAGKPSILVPFPFAADNHQLHNAEAFTRAGAARLVLDSEMTGQRLFDEITKLNADRAALTALGARARTFARPGAAARAADVLEQVSR